MSDVRVTYEGDLLVIEGYGHREEYPGPPAIIVAQINARSKLVTAVLRDEKPRVVLVEKERPRRMAAATAALGLAALAGPAALASFLPRPRPPREHTKYDDDRLAKAEAKRARRRARNQGGSRGKPNDEPA